MEGARFECEMLGLDEPPGPILCKFKITNVVFYRVKSRISDASSIITLDTNRSMNEIPYPSINAVRITSANMNTTTEVEIS